MSKAPKQFLDALERWRNSPATMVRELFQVEPDHWQEDVLNTFPTHPRIALLASKGVGKTATLAWLIWNFMLTRPQPKIACISIDSANLSDGLWTELAYWMDKAPLLKKFFTWQKTRIESKSQPETWWCSARSWAKAASKEQQANSLAGLHSPYILFILDESGAMPEGILANAENALSTCIEGHIIQAGNPTHLDGPLYRAYKDSQKINPSWKVVRVSGDPDDPKRSKLVKVEWARKQVADYGRENSWVRVNVFGEFPDASLNALIGIDEVEAAMKRYYREGDISNMARIMSIDVARQGDDSSVIARRQGLQMFPFLRYRNLTGIQGASIANRVWQEFDCDACFVDATGGFGFTWVDQLTVLGRSPIAIGFADEAKDSGRYYNRRAEMAFNFVEWIKAGGALPPAETEGSEQLKEALVATTYTFKGDRLILEPKDQVKAKLGYSPDEFDAAMLSHAEPIAKSRNERRANHNAFQGTWNPFGSPTEQPRNMAATNWDPFSGR